MSRTRQQDMQDSGFEIKTLPIVGKYNVQRFPQWSPEDCANWYIVKDDESKLPHAMYPTMGRAHINYLGVNQLIYGSQPRAIFKTIDYFYVVDGNSIFQVDAEFNQINISQDVLETISGDIYFTYLVVNTIIYAVFVDTQKIYVYQEGTGSLQIVTDPNAPGNFTVDGQLTKPGYVAAFGNRIVVSVANSSQFVLSAINLGNVPFNAATCFTNANGQVFASENGIIRQMGVLNNTLYIFCDYITGVWSNSPAIFSGTGVTFPWKQNSTYNWNFGIANPRSLDVDFGMIVFLGQNNDGLLQFMKSTGGQPESFNSKAISTLLQKYSNALGNNSPFLVENSNGFLYQYEDVIFYRMAGGNYTNSGILDQLMTSNSIEHNFDTNTWGRCIELDGERNRIQDHIYFNNMHLVTLTGDNTIYQMSGEYYYNEIRNPDEIDPQAFDAYLAYPFRYERITPIIFERDYSEFETEFVQIDFVFGDSNINYSTAPFGNAQFIVDEQTDSGGNIQYIVAENADADGQPVFILAENSNTPGLADNTYNILFKPHIELFWSDDGGILFHSADVRQFSQMGVYSWRMRWYQLGCSRNRVYKLIAVSPVPIVVLGGAMNVRRVSGGAY